MSAPAASGPASGVPRGSQRGPERVSGAQWAVDSVVALGVFGFACLQLVLAISLLVPDPALRRAFGVQVFSPTPLAILLVAATTLPLVARRRFPWPVFVVTSAVWTVLQYQIGAVSVSLIGPLIALFTVALQRQRVESIVAGVILLALVIAAPFAAVNQALTQLTLLQNVALVVAAWFAGFALQTRQEYVHEAEERARQAEMTRETLARQRVEAERVRIAREVHDITAHSLSAVSIQAAAAERLMTRDPEAAGEAIAAARQTAKTALADIRAMVGVLRDGDEAEAATGPTRGTDALVELMAYLRDGGVEPKLDDRDYDRGSVPSHIDVALFRIAREASTNILRHAAATEARFLLASDGRTVRLTITDNGRGPANSAAPSLTPPQAGGHGIEGMAERVALLGGTLRAGPGEDGGFTVAVTIPLGGDDG